MSVEKHQHADGWVSDETYRIMRRNCEEYKKKCVENEELKKQNEDLKKQNEALKKHNEKLQDNLNTIADALDMDYEENANIDMITEDLGEKLNTLDEWEHIFDGQDAGGVECELNDRNEECDELREKISKLEKEMEELKKKNTQLENIKYRVEQTEKSGIDVAKMKKELDKISENIVEITGMKEKIEELKKENEELRICEEELRKFVDIINEVDGDDLCGLLKDAGWEYNDDGELVEIQEEEEEDEEDDEGEEEKGYRFIKSKSLTSYILEVKDLKTGGNTRRFTSSIDKKDDSVCVWDTQFKQMIIEQGLDDFSKMMDALNEKMMKEEKEKKKQERIKKGLPIKNKGKKKKKSR